MALPTFEDILMELKKKEMKGIGPLTRYDTATQLAFPDNMFHKKSIYVQEQQKEQEHWMLMV
jgi:hypothetical protein